MTQSCSALRLAEDKGVTLLCIPTNGLQKQSFCSQASAAEDAESAHSGNILAGEPSSPDHWYTWHFLDS